MQTWTDDDGVVHDATHQSALMAVCGQVYESHVKPVAFDIGAQTVTCVWCALERPRGLAENIVLVYNKKYGRAHVPAGQGRGRSPARTRRRKT